MTAGADPDGVQPLRVSGLSHKYGDFVALQPCDFAVGRGEFVALIGSNGAGKSTLLTTVAGLLEPSAGSALVEGHPAGSLAARAAASYIPDTPVLYEDLSLLEHLEYVAGMHGVADWQSRAEALLNRFQLEAWAEHLPSEFSRGMRQKASLAIGLIRPFSLLLADEPFDGLDPQSRTLLLGQLLDETRQSGASALVSTHRQEVIDASSRCIALSDGRLEYDGSPTPSG